MVAESPDEERVLCAALSEELLRGRRDRRVGQLVASASLRAPAIDENTVKLTVVRACRLRSHSGDIH
jgi:hypothetical protein